MNIRDGAILSAIGFLAAMGVVVDFASALLSMLGDLVMMGAAFAGAYYMLRVKNKQIRRLEDEMASMRSIGVGMVAPALEHRMTYGLPRN